MCGKWVWDTYDDYHKRIIRGGDAIVGNSEMNIIMIINPWRPSFSGVGFRLCRTTSLEYSLEATVESDLSLDEMKEMIELPGGTCTFMKEIIEIPDGVFAIGKYAVTQALWESVMGNNPSRFKGKSSVEM